MDRSFICGFEHCLVLITTPVDMDLELMLFMIMYFYTLLCDHREELGNNANFGSDDWVRMP
jgi:hypothetical protein